MRGRSCINTLWRGCGGARGEELLVRVFEGGGVVACERSRGVFSRRRGGGERGQRVVDRKGGAVEPVRAERRGGYRKVGHFKVIRGGVSYRDMSELSELQLCFLGLCGALKSCK